MSSGRAHKRASFILAPVAAAGIGWLTRSVGAGLWAGAGCAAVVLVTPDLDQEGISAGEWDLVQAFGPLGSVGFLWLAYWHPYAWAIPHRSPWSHLPVFGTLLRVLYLVPLAVAAAMVVSAATRWLALDMSTVDKVMWSMAFWRVAWWAFVGLCVSDTVHFLMDVLSSRWRVKRGYR